jgi:hypothetical protein
MPTSTFFNDNLFRAYPFVATEEPTGFPTKRIVGMKVLCGFGSYFQSFPEVELNRWEVLSDRHRVTFWLHEGTYSNHISMEIPKNTPQFAHLFSQESQHTRIRLTVGDLSDATQSFHGLSLRLEPTCILWLKHRGIDCIQVVNENRERLAEVINGNPILSPEHKAAWLHTKFWRQPLLIGDEGLLFNEGSNCEWSTSLTENRLIVWPRVRCGTGQVREFQSLGVTSSGAGSALDGISEIPPNLDEMKIRPDGLLHQDNVLYAFCGATGPEITAERKQSIQVRNDVDANTVSIAVASLNGKGC